MTTVLMALAGGLGALSRVEATAWLRGHHEGPWATRIVNVVGAALLALLVSGDASGDLRRVLGTGFLGGFTTFSTWMVEADAQQGAARAVELVVPPLLGVSVVAIVRMLG